MSVKFSANVRPSGELIETVSNLSPYNPFYTGAYVNARASIGELPCVFTLQSGRAVVMGCTGFLRGNYFTRKLEVTSVPNVAAPEVFWEGVRRFCRTSGVWDLCLDSFASTRTTLPFFNGELTRRVRCEYILEVDPERVFGSLRADHRRKIRTSQRLGVELRRTSDLHACDAHTELLLASIQRRIGNHKQVSISYEDSTIRALVKHHAGEMFQAVRNGVILSSILVLKSRAAAYSHTMASSIEGMQTGASVFLIFQTLQALRHERIQIFNLGGAGPENLGLKQFKEGFRAREVHLEAAAFSMVSPMKRIFRTVAQRIKHMPSFFVQRRHELSAHRDIL